MYCGAQALRIVEAVRSLIRADVESAEVTTEVRIIPALWMRELWQQGYPAGRTNVLGTAWIWNDQACCPDSQMHHRLCCEQQRTN